MKILLIVYDNDSHLAFFPMATAALAAYCRREGFEVDIYQQDIHHYPDEHLTEFLDANHYDVVGLSFIGAYYPYQRAVRISKAIRAAKKPPFYVIGGHGPSPEPEYFLRLLDADVVVMGEGEETFIELLKTLEILEKGQTPSWSVGSIRGLAYIDGDNVVINERREPIADIDTLPTPAYDLFPMEIYRLRRDSGHVASVGNRFSVQMLSGRGCKFSCNFCYRIDKGMRLRSDEAILGEMNYLYHKWDIRHFMFYDDLLMESEVRTISLCEAFIKRGPPGMTFTCQGRLNYATLDVLRTMKRAGCSYIYYGIESFNDDMLAVMGKALTCGIIRLGMKNTREAGLRCSPNIIFGNIGETAAHLQSSVDFLLEFDDCTQLRAIKPVTPYPGSPLYDYAIKEGLLEGPADFYEHKHTNTDLLSVNFTAMDDDQFYRELCLANSQVVSNYSQALWNGYDKQLDHLYRDRDASFRGFRHA